MRSHCWIRASSDLEIGRRIHALLQDRKELSAQIQRGIELVSRRFSARTLIGEIEHDYLELLARKGNWRDCREAKSRRAEVTSERRRRCDRLRYASATSTPHNLAGMTC